MIKNLHQPKWQKFSIYFLIAVVFSAFNVSAQTTTFAQFLENNGTQDFVFTNNSTNASFNTVPGGSSISFRYQNISGLDPSLQGFQNAHLTISTTATQTAVNNSGNLSQPLDQIVTVEITRDTPAPVGNGTRRNLLTAVFSSSGNTPVINGNSSSATLNAATPNHNVTFTSDFIRFTTTTARNLSFSFSSVTPVLAIGAGNFLDSFTAAGTGTFASNPVPSVIIPTAASAEVGGRVLTSDGRALRNAKVVLVESDGTIHRTQTGTFGHFNFAGISVGQTVVISVNSKRYSFASQIVPLNDTISELNFTAEQ